MNAYDVVDNKWIDGLFKIKRGADEAKNTWFFKGICQDPEPLLSQIWKSFGHKFKRRSDSHAPTSPKTNDFQERKFPKDPNSRS